jgi:hypothetical protein
MICRRISEQAIIAILQQYLKGILFTALVSGARSAGSRFVTSSPRKKMFPSVAGTRFIIAIPMVVFPLPLSPTRPTVLPAGITNETPVTALTWPIVQRNSDDFRGNQTLRLQTSRIFT